ncbi:nuclear transport factor 2 family protein [Microbaculum sp. FT89]|uniref:nuclear transport factor 2 family protein n=1 Tax=Microbaculum sp. FT89 TaxID=3447298 RepID=UPI003F52AB2B
MAPGDTSGKTAADTARHRERLETLDRFIEAWNAHDVDGLMACMAQNCAFHASGGPDADGTVFEGREAVRKGYAGIFAGFPDAQWTNGRHHVFGDRGLSQWRFVGTAPDGTRVEVDGCDLFTFDGPLIALKDSYRKSRV